MLSRVKKYLFKQKYSIDFLVVITGQKCTLHCKHCANFSPYFSSKFDFYNIEAIIQDLEKITKEVESIKLLQLQGGDFFLHRDINRLLQYIENNNRIELCQIAHNCIIKPKGEVLSILKNPKFILRLSSYGLANEFHEDEISEYLHMHRVRFRYHSYANENGTWSYLGGVEQPRADFSKTQERYHQCAFRYCLTLENGIISRCSRATVAHHIQKFIPRECDFINVREDFTIDKLQQYINNALTDKGIVEACYYCNGSSGGGKSQLENNFHQMSIN